MELSEDSELDRIRILPLLLKLDTDEVVEAAEELLSAPSRMEITVRWD